MKKIKFTEKFGKGLSKNFLKTLDEKIGRKVPEEIRWILGQSNGGYPKFTVFPISGLRDNEDGEIRYFYGVDETPDRDLAWVLENYEGRMLPELFPFACNGSGDEICLVTEGKNAGQVVFWDSYREKKLTWNNVYKIADTFEEFIDGLTEYFDEEEE